MQGRSPRFWIVRICLALCWAFVLPAYAARIEISPGPAACEMRIRPDDSMGARIELRLVRETHGGVSMSIPRSTLRRIEIVIADRREPFGNLRWPDDESFLDSETVGLLLNQPELHVTGWSRSGGVRSSRFDGLDREDIGTEFVQACPHGPSPEELVRAERDLNLSFVDIQLISWILHNINGGRRLPEQMPSRFGPEQRVAIARFARANGYHDTEYLDGTLYRAIFAAGGFRIPPMFDEADIFSGGVAAAKINDIWGLLNMDGRWVVKPRFVKIRGTKEGLMPALAGGRWGVVNKAGSIIHDFVHDEILLCAESRCPFRRNDRWGYIDKRGSVAIDSRFKRGFMFRDGVAIVRTVNPLARESEDLKILRRGFIDRKGNWLYPPIFNDVYIFREGLAPVKVLGKWGYLDLTLVRERALRRKP